MGFSLESKLILFVGRLVHGKGVEKLLEVFNQISTVYPKVHLIIVGTGDIELFMPLAQNDIGRISFTGKLTYSQVEQLYQIADIGIIPSEFEQCSYVALEMMKHGLPIIASSVPGMRELFEHEKDAILVSIRNREDGLLGSILNKDSLYKKIELLINNKILSKSLAINAKKSWEYNFTAERMGKETIDVYKKSFHLQYNLQTLI